MTISQNDILQAIGEMVAANSEDKPATEPAIEQTDGECDSMQHNLSQYFTSTIQNRNKKAKRST